MQTRDWDICRNIESALFLKAEQKTYIQREKGKKDYWRRSKTNQKDEALITLGGAERSSISDENIFLTENL